MLALQLCPNDENEALELAKLICDVEPKRRGDVEIFISARRGTNREIVRRMHLVFETKFKKVISYHARRYGHGWPAGCNDLWAETIMRVDMMKRAGQLNGTWVLTFEADCVMLSPHWLDLLTIECALTDLAGKWCCGHAHSFEDDKGNLLPPQHINGNAIFKIGVHREHSDLVKKGSPTCGWDAYHGDLLMRIGRDSPEIYQMYRLADVTRPMLESVRKNGRIPALFHGIKHAAAIPIIREMMADGSFYKPIGERMAHCPHIFAKTTTPLRGRKDVACIVKPHYAGLFSQINKVMTCAEMYKQVSVDLRGSIYGEDNVWNHLFTTHEWPRFPRPMPTDTIVNYPHERYTNTQAAGLYRSKTNWRHRLHAQWSKFQVRQSIKDEVSLFCEGVDGPMIAVQVRANISATEQVSGISQSLERYAEAIEDALAEYKSTAVFVMCNCLEPLLWLDDRFPCVWRDIRRTPTREVDLHIAEKQTPKDAKDALVDVMIAARCRALIHPTSNMATAALYINPALVSIWLP